MPKMKSKKPPIDDEVPVLPPEPAAPVRRADSGMVLDMEGYGGEVASALIVNGLRAYLSVVNKGISLVACNRAHTAFVPVVIAASVSALDIKRDETKPLVDADGVVVFLVDDGDERWSYYLPVAEYLARAETRGDSGLRLEFDAHAEWLEMYEGHPGVRRAFARLFV